MYDKMKTMTLTRTETSEQGTFGVLTDSEGKQFCYTGELPFAGGDASIPNERSVDCIPTGSYVCAWTYSPRFKKNTYRLLQVRNRDGILIHSGNYCGDTNKGLLSHVEGCILLGTKRGKLNNQKVVLNSKIAVDKLENTMLRKEFVLVIQNKF